MGNINLFIQNDNVNILRWRGSSVILFFYIKHIWEILINPDTPVFQNH